MGKKKTKKNQKQAHKAEAKKKAEAEKEDEEIERQDDLFVSDLDTELICNFIRTTNKSFISLGNTVVETFMNRCSLGIGHALMSLFDETCPDKDDVIRRLNIIYIMYRLPDVEPEIRQKPTKTMNDIYNHMFSSFLFYAEGLELEKESQLARMICSNNASMFEKCTAIDFIRKDFDPSKFVINREEHQNWENQNTNHWPKDLEEAIPLAILMRHAGWERKIYEMGIHETFYPLFHPAPTLLPNRLSIQRAEVKFDESYHSLLATEEMYRNKPLFPDAEPFDDRVGTHQRMLAAFEQYKNEIKEYQAKRHEKLTAEEKEEADEIVEYNPDLDILSESENETTSVEDSDDEEQDVVSLHKQQGGGKFVLVEMTEKSVGGCIDKMLNGVQLRNQKAEIMAKYVRQVPWSNANFLRLQTAQTDDDNVALFIKHNAKVGSELLIRMAKKDGIAAFARYVEIMQTLEVGVQAMETLLRMSRELKKDGLLTRLHQEEICKYVNFCFSHCEKTNNHRTVRLVSVLSIRLLKENVIKADDIFADVKPFVLKYSTNREATSLYKFIVEQRGKSNEERETEELKRLYAEKIVLKGSGQPSSKKPLLDMPGISFCTLPSASGNSIEMPSEIPSTSSKSQEEQEENSEVSTTEAKPQTIVLDGTPESKDPEVESSSS